MKKELNCFDLHYTVEKWGVLLRGYPAASVPDFGWNIQFRNEFPSSSEEGQQLRLFAATAYREFRGIAKMK